jgi:DNA-binding NtrC family response regulator/pSer/pThr/pTyr-binding forkhead associated (FHA) protein
MRESQSSYCLLVYKKGQIITTYEIFNDDTIITIGRHSGNDINLTGDTSISRIHAVLVRIQDSSIEKGMDIRHQPKNGLFLLRDLSSAHGTKIGKSYIHKWLLKDGDTINIGSYTLIWKTNNLSDIGEQGLPLNKRYGELPQPAESRTGTALSTIKGFNAGSNNQDHTEFLSNVTKSGYSEDFMENPQEFLFPLMTILASEKAVLGCHEAGLVHITYQKGFDRESPYCSPEFLNNLSTAGSIRQEGAIWTVLSQNGFMGLFRLRPPAFNEEDMRFMNHACESLLKANSLKNDLYAYTPWLTPIVGLFDQQNECNRIVNFTDSDNNDLLILGETGTGKEILARYIHEHSNRRNKPFITANCGSLPLDLVYSELFGHEKGSFTNAVDRKAGYFEMANGGTLFLDEIGDIPEHVQVAVLTALQQRRIQRLGGKESIPVDIRVIGATDQDIDSKMKENSFRRALYERFAFKIRIPPLRERQFEIPLLSYYFLDKISEDILSISRDALECLRNYEWPGNVRELKAVIKAASIDKKGAIFSWDLPDAIRYTKKVRHVLHKKDKTLKELEKERIIEALEETRGNIGETIRILGISRATLYNKFKEYELQTPGRAIQ